MNSQEILEDIFNQNPWFETGQIEIHKKIIKRDVLDDLITDLEKPYANVIVGLRRTGKTTLLKLMIEHLLKENEKCRVIYFSFDLFKVSLRDVIRQYEEHILKEPLNECKDRVFILFDEVQKINDWGNEIKTYLDRDLNIKFILTGSSSMNITKGAGESLVGRIRVKKLKPFSFGEFLDYKKEDRPVMKITEPVFPLNSSKIRIVFNEYFELGGLPEFYEDLPMDILSQNLDLIFFRDIIEMFPVKRVDILKSLFIVCAENTSQRINFEKISRDLGTQFRTVKEYLQYLQDSFLVTTSIPCGKSSISRLRKSPKGYVCDHVYNRLFKCKEGQKAETVAFNHLSRIEEPCFIKDPEIDIVLPERKQAFEVKYTKKTSKKDVRNLIKAAEDLDLFLVTKNTYDKWNVKGREVQLLPLWMLCLME